MLNKFLFHKVTIVFVSIVSVGALLFLHNNQSEKVQTSLSKNVIRFHVRANSDTLIDQSLKMQVKEEVVNYINSNSSDFTSLDDAKNFISSHDNQIKESACSVIQSHGFSYNVVSEFDTQTFPEKSYGDITFPSGDYLSYTLNIGSGAGHNWWCVLYPPLCFVDASTGVLPDSSKELLKENISQEDYEYVSENETVFRFKYLTFLNGLFD